MTDDPDADLTGAERDVLRVVADMAITKGIERLALPRRVLQEHTGLGLTALRSTLKRLDQTGLLVLAEAGRAGGPSARKRRANLYRIAGADTPALAPYLYRGTRSVVPPTQICGAPPADAHGAQHQICGAPQEPTRPTPETDTEQETNVITLTLSSKDPQDLADAIAALGRTGQVQVTKQEPSLPENVVPIRGTGTEGPRP
jgi:hypothetical protein